LEWRFLKQLFKKTRRYAREASLSLCPLSSEAIGNQALRGCPVALVRTRKPQFHRVFSFRKCHSTLIPISPAPTSPPLASRRVLPANPRALSGGLQPPGQ